MGLILPESKLFSDWFILERIISGLVYFSVNYSQTIFIPGDVF